MCHRLLLDVWAKLRNTCLLHLRCFFALRIRTLQKTNSSTKMSKDCGMDHHRHFLALARNFLALDFVLCLRDFYSAKHQTSTKNSTWIQREFVGLPFYNCLPLISLNLLKPIAKIISIKIAKNCQKIVHGSNMIFFGPLP